MQSLCHQTFLFQMSFLLLCHYSYSNLTLGSDTSWRELSWIPNLWETKIEKNTCQRKTITCIRQYLCGSVICLHPRSCRDITIIREEYRVQPSATIFSLCLKHDNNTILKNPNYERRFCNGLNKPKNIARILHIKKNHAILFGSGCQTRSNKTRLHKAQLFMVKGVNIKNKKLYAIRGQKHPDQKSWLSIKLKVMSGKTWEISIRWSTCFHLILILSK